MCHGKVNLREEAFLIVSSQICFRELKSPCEYFGILIYYSFIFPTYVTSPSEVQKNLAYIAPHFSLTLSHPPDFSSSFQPEISTTFSISPKDLILHIARVADLLPTSQDRPTFNLPRQTSRKHRDRLTCDSQNEIQLRCCHDETS